MRPKYISRDFAAIIEARDRFCKLLDTLTDVAGEHSKRNELIAYCNAADAFDAQLVALMARYCNDRTLAEDSEEF